ncbi:MAG: IspD/TarI family cytidylyltransferase [Micromonosporaceae bacterium]
MFSLVLANGGTGTRIDAGQPKQFVSVHGKPIMAYSLLAIEAVAEIDEVVLNYPEGWREETERLVAAHLTKPVTYVPPGGSRQESIRALLAHCRGEHILLHETARPMVSAEDFRALIAAPHDNIGYLLPIPFTVVHVDPDARQVTGALDRSKLRNVQLPQRFRKADLIEGHEYAAREGIVATEDGTLVVLAGFEMFYLDGADRNIKVTTPTDVRIAELMLGDEHG